MEITTDVTYFILILARITGCVIFNQIFGRGNVPLIFQLGLSIMLAITVYGVLPPTSTYEINLIIEYIISIAKELFIGLVIGQIIKMFLSAIVISGDMIDMQMGLSMSKIYDPSSNISMGISASILNLMYMLIFFSVGGHMTLIQIFITSCKAIPIGQVNINTDVYQSIVQLFSYILIYAVKLTLPILAAEFIIEVAMGIMMKVIPQIQIFVVNIPLKIFIGLALILILVPSFAAFLERLITLMFEAIQNNLSLLM